MDKRLSKTAQMETVSIPKLIFRYSTVTFCALLFDALYNIVDTLFVSRGVGDDAMGGVSIVFPFMLIQSGIAQMVGGGAAVIVSQKLGEKDYRGAGSVTANAMLVFYSSAVLVTVLGYIFMLPILNLLGVTQDILPFAKEYFAVVLAGNVFSTGFSSIIRAEGKMTYGLLIWLIPTAINIVLDAVFIYGLDMGVKGAALATVICYFSSFLMSVLFFVKISCQKFNIIKIELNTIKEILFIGVPTLLQTGSISLMFLLINHILSKISGTLGVNAFAYISKLAIFAVVPINAVSQAVSPVFAYNFGASKGSRVKKTLKYSICITVLYSIIISLAAISVPQLFVKMFTNNSEIIMFSDCALRIIAPATVFLSVALILSIYFQSLGRKSTAIITSASVLIFLIIMLFLLAYLFGTIGIWISLPAASALSAAFAGLNYFVLKKRGKL